MQTTYSEMALAILLAAFVMLALYLVATGVIAPHEMDAIMKMRH